MAKADLAGIDALLRAEPNLLQFPASVEPEAKESKRRNKA